MKNAAKMRSLVVGIFDSVVDLDRALERLATARFEVSVYDDAVRGGRSG
jgi:hypothetical protein